MPELILPPPPPQPSPERLLRVEYLGFQNVAEHREFRLRAFGPDGSTEFRFRIAVAAFAAGRIRLQDGPDVCYQKLLRAVAAGETASLDSTLIEDVDLARYREAHTPAPKHRPTSFSSTPKEAVAPRKPPRTSAPRLPVAPTVTNDAEPALQAGQRVRHALFGDGVTTSSSGGRTGVHFDLDGLKTFVTTMLDVAVLSAPHTWETGPRGHNRPCEATTILPPSP
jgi:hypothetical protein